MLSNDLLPLFDRDLERLAKEIDAFTDADALWKVPPGVTNSCGNLCLHLCGNLQHFIGHVLGGSAYVRDREREFNVKGVPKTELLAEIANTRSAVMNTLPKLMDAALDAPFPVKVFSDEMTTAQFLIHLQGHLNYHLGQINYLRRIHAQ